jgi:hypothetical protein
MTTTDEAAPVTVTTADALRGLAGCLDSLPAELGLTIEVYASTYTDNITKARKLRKLMPGGWRKFTSPARAYIDYVRDFGGGVSMSVNVSKGSTCERVQVDTTHVPAVEAHDEPVYEWRC